MQQITSTDADREAAKSAAKATADAARSEPSVPTTTRPPAPTAVRCATIFHHDHRAVSAAGHSERDRTQEGGKNRTSASGAQHKQRCLSGLLHQRLRRTCHHRPPDGYEVGMCGPHLRDADIGYLSRRVQRTGFQFDKTGPRRERHPWIVGREKDDQCSGAMERLLGCPVECLIGVLLAVVADKDGHLPDRTVSRRTQRLRPPPPCSGRICRTAAPAP